MRYRNSGAFERRVRELLQTAVLSYGVIVEQNPHPQAFPDIVSGQYGIEVKFTENDNWRSIANSVFESTRDPGVQEVYIVFGKMGGSPTVAWGRYDESVIHVRTSHVPRFEVEMFPEGRPRNRPPLFELMGTTYDQFAQLSMGERMALIRDYARGRLKPGERLWWIEEQPDQGHSLPLEVRLLYAPTSRRQAAAEGRGRLYCVRKSCNHLESGVSITTLLCIC